MKVSDPFVKLLEPISHSQLLLLTINVNEIIIIEVTLPPNQSTSPYAIRMMVKFLKIVYTGMGKYCNALEPV